MKKLINKVFGVNIYATSKNVQGRKSSGIEDESGYKNWAYNKPLTNGGWRADPY